MTRRRRRSGVGALVRELRAQSDRIIDAIREVGAEQSASRDAMADAIMVKGAGFLRAALDEAAPRTVVLDPPAANDTGGGAEGERDPGPKTPPGGPANDDEPPESGRR